MLCVKIGSLESQDNSFSRSGEATDSLGPFRAFDSTLLLPAVEIGNLPFDDFQLTAPGVFLFNAKPLLLGLDRGDLLNGGIERSNKLGTDPGEFSERLGKLPLDSDDNRPLRYGRRRFTRQVCDDMNRHSKLTFLGQISVADELGLQSEFHLGLMVLDLLPGRFALGRFKVEHNDPMFDTGQDRIKADGLIGCGQDRVSHIQSGVCEGKLLQLADEVIDGGWV